MKLLGSVLAHAMVLGLVGSLAVASPRAARADLLHGLSFRVGSYLTTERGARDTTGAWAAGVGLDYVLPIGQEDWRTSLSVDLLYRKGMGMGIFGDDGPGTEVAFRYIPVSLNHVYLFPEQSGSRPYLGVCVTAATYGNSGNPPIEHQPMITRFGGGVVFGVDFAGDRFYVQGSYEKFVPGHAAYVPNGFRAVLGYRF